MGYLHRWGRLVGPSVLVCVAATAAAAAPCDTAGPAFVVDNLTCQLSGVYTFTSVTLRNNATVEVVPYAGGSKLATGNLELRAPIITIDATSRIVAKGAGYQTLICGDGGGPNPAAGGQGGCAVRDSGGGGAHFGRGGRGTKDISGTQSFPRDFEEDCGNSVVYNASGVPSCAVTTNCRAGNDGLPTVAGQEFYHSIYQPEFGAAGGDKGCRDGDGTTVNTAGPGGGRVVLAALDATQTGQIAIAGRIDTNGRRGCGNGNDSAGGGAGGTVFLVGDNVMVTATARITAAGGLGGDTQGLSADPTGECVAPAQQGGTCDDCGGGGGGGIISVLSVNGLIADESVFNVGGALGGTCPICQGEAGGGVGELQISGGYVGEFCDGFDNDFDDQVDEGLPPLSCPSGPVPACVGGVPQSCPPDVPACVGPVTDTRARFMVVVDTSGSMLGSLAGVPTFGDGSLDHPGLDQDGDGLADDARLYKAKGALSTVIAAYPEIDFALARYHQDTAIDRSCQVAGWFECASICCSYDNPTNNTGAALCNVDGGSLGPIPARATSPGDECINYAGNCGPPRRGADVLVGFGNDPDRYLGWLDGAETAFNPGQAVGDYCPGGDCELRGTGPTPLANSLAAAQDYLTPVKACDAAAGGGCRRYGVILLTDGAESCQGDPVAAAAALRGTGIDTFVVGFSVLGGEQAQLNAIAAAGGTGAAFLVGDEDELANALATIVSGSIVFETCNDLDDDCDSRIDEDFPTKGLVCDDGRLGQCLGTGAYVCAADGSGVVCDITNPGAAPSPEVCNGLDDDCDGAIDDGISCIPGCVPTSTVDLCNGLDDDCDGAFDEDDPAVGLPCGSNDMAPCRRGTQACIAGQLVCVGAIEPGVETCNGLDDDCDGLADDLAACPGATSCVEGACRVPCAGGEFPCPAGLTCADTPDGPFCVPDACAACAANELCQNNMCVDPCADVTCAAPEVCRLGTCVDCDVLGCPGGQVCVAATCVADPCAGVDCAASCTDSLGCSCYAGECRGNCADDSCPAGQRCDPSGACVADPCVGVTCPGNDVCRAGACVADPCVGVFCGVGAVCQDGACIDDPCKVIDCSPGFTCILGADGPRCAADGASGYRPELVTAAGGGCSTGGGGVGWGGLALVLALAVTRRRRS
ncbi:MAG: MopE-related protein [Kofleriaceae bacterium]